MKTLGLIISIVFITSIFFSCNSASESPSDVLNKYHQAIWDKDVDAVMELSVPEESRAQVEAIIEFRSEGMKRSGGLPVILGEKIDGDKAFVRCKFGPVEQEIKLRKVDGQWRVE